MDNNHSVALLTAYNFNHSLVTIGLLEALGSEINLSQKIIVANTRTCYDDLRRYGLQDWRIAHGSNKHHEFSAWQEGLDHITKPFNKLSYCIFANDTLGRPRGHLGSREIRELEKALKKQYSNAAIGVVHQSPAEFSDMQILKYSANNWISTGIFALTGTALANLNGRVNYFSDLQHLVDWDNQSDSVFSSSIDPSLRSHIEHWLYYGGWNKANGPPSTQKELHIIRMKSMMILCEHYLSAQLRSNNIRIININPHAKPSSLLQRSLRYFTKPIDLQLLKQARDK